MKTDLSAIETIISIVLVPLSIAVIVLFVKGLVWLAKRPKRKLLGEISFITDENDLMKYFMNQDQDIRRAAEERMNQLAMLAETPAAFLKIAENPRIRLKESVFMEALSRFDDEDFLYRLVKGTSVPDAVRFAAAERIRDKDHLCEIALSSTLPDEIRINALKRINDQEDLLTIAVHSEWKAAIDLLDEEHLRQMGEILCRLGKHDYVQTEERFESGEYDNDRHYRIVTYTCKRCGKVKVEEHGC